MKKKLLIWIVEFIFIIGLVNALCSDYYLDFGNSYSKLSCETVKNNHNSYPNNFRTACESSGQCCLSGNSWNGTSCVANCAVASVGSVNAGCGTLGSFMSTALGYCTSGSCRVCNSGYSWDGTACIPTCPDTQQNVPSGFLGCSENTLNAATVNNYCASGTCLKCEDQYAPQYSIALDSYTCQRICPAGQTYSNGACMSNCPIPQVGINEGFLGCMDSKFATNANINTGYFCNSLVQGGCYRCSDQYTPKYTESGISCQRICSNEQTYSNGMCTQNCAAPELNTLDAGCGVLSSGMISNNDYCASGTCRICSQGYLWNGDSCVSSACVIDSVSITPSTGCVGNVCSQGDTLSVSVSYSGDCSRAGFVQVDFMSSDGSCVVQGSGVSMKGFGKAVSLLSGSGSLSFSYPLGFVSDVCGGKSLVDGYAMFYSDSSMVSSVSSVKSFVNSVPVVFDECSNVGFSVGSYSKFPESPVLLNATFNSSGGFVGSCVVFDVVRPVVDFSNFSFPRVVVDGVSVPVCSFSARDFCVYEKNYRDVLSYSLSSVKYGSEVCGFYSKGEWLLNVSSDYVSRVFCSDDFVSVPLVFDDSFDREFLRPNISGSYICDDSVSYEQFCKLKGYSSFSVRSVNSYSGGPCLRYANGVWGTSGSNLYHVNCTGYLGKEDYKCGDLDGMCPDELLGIPICGKQQNGLSLDPDCGVHTYMKCAPVSFDGLLNLTGIKSAACSYTGDYYSPHKECLDGQCAVKTPTSIECKDPGSVFNVNGKNVTCSDTRAVICPKDFEYNAQADVCSRGGASYCDVSTPSNASDNLCSLSFESISGKLKDDTMYGLKFKTCNYCNEKFALNRDCNKLIQNTVGSTVSFTPVRNLPFNPSRQECTDIFDLEKQKFSEQFFNGMLKSYLADNTKNNCLRYSSVKITSVNNASKITEVCVPSSSWDNYTFYSLTSVVIN